MNRMAFFTYVDRKMLKQSISQVLDIVCTHYFSSGFRNLNLTFTIVHYNEVAPDNISVTISIAVKPT